MAAGDEVMRYILAISSISVILFCGLYLYQENIAPEWRAHQHNYLDQIGNMPVPTGTPKTDQFSFKVELKQIWLSLMNRVDRCGSCHLALEDLRFKSKPNPLKTHPQGYLEAHDPEKHGCTICHDGQGRAIRFREAAGDDPYVFWNKPLLRKPFLEANCYRCHIDFLDQTPAYNLGRQIFESRGCLGCHKRDGVGGSLGPEFRGIGDASVRLKYPEITFEPEVRSLFNSNLNLAYIYEAVRFPQAQPEATLMFDFRFSHEDATTLTVYLKSLAKHPTGVQRLLPKPVHPLSMIEKGEKIFGRFCTACHGRVGRGGVKNPNSLSLTIPNLNTLAERMFLYQNENREAVIAILEKTGDLLTVGEEADIPGFFKVIAKYMSVNNIIINGRIADKKHPAGPTPINMPAWKKTILEDEIPAVIAYLISIY